MKNKRTTLVDFIKRARTVHGDKYGYSKVVYTTTECKVEILCPEHGSFYLRPRAHYADKRGCPECGKPNKSGIRAGADWIDKPKRLYLVKFKNKKEEFIKVGVTTEINAFVTFQKRQVTSLYNIELIIDELVDNANRIEEFIKNAFKQARYVPLIKFSGSHSECFDIKATDTIYASILKLL